MVESNQSDPNVLQLIPLDQRALTYVEEELRSTGLTLSAHLLCRRADWGMAHTYRARADSLDGLYDFAYGRRAPAVLNYIALAHLWREFREEHGGEREESRSDESRYLVFEDVVRRSSDPWPREDGYKCVCLGEEVYNLISDDLPTDLGALSRRINLNWAPGGAGAFVQILPSLPLSGSGLSVQESYIESLARGAVAFMVRAYDGEGIIMVDLLAGR